MSSRENEAIASFVDIAGIDQGTARDYLNATDYDVDQAIGLYFANNTDVGQPALSSEALVQQLSQERNGNGDMPSLRQGNSGNGFEDEKVRAPIPAMQDRLYGDMPYFHGLRSNGNRFREVNAFRDFEEEGVRRRTKNNKQNDAKPGLGAMFEPPRDLLFLGTFEEARIEASTRSMWLLVNLQSNQEFASHQLNRDTWGDSTLKDILRSSFIFLQLDDASPEGSIFQAYYKTFVLPAIVVVDPVTGSAMRTFTGFVSSERLMEELVPYLDHSPNDPMGPKISGGQHKRRHTQAQSTGSEPPLKSDDLERALAMSMEPEQLTNQAEQPGLSQQPDRLPSPGVAQQAVAAVAGASNPSNTDLVKEEKDPAVVQEEARAQLPPETDAVGEGACRVRVRLPDGSNLTRKFLKIYPLETLRLFCIASSPEAASGKPFNLLQTGRGGPATILDDMDQTLAEAGLANSVVAMSWA